MIKDFFRYSLILLFLSSCTSEVDLKSIDYSALLCDGNSKVWLVDMEVIDGIDITENLLYSKKLIIFHNSGTFNFIQMNKIGDTPPERGYFFMDNNNKTLRLDFKNESWLMNAKYITEDSLLFEPNDQSSKKIGMKIVFFPEL